MKQGKGSFLNRGAAQYPTGRRRGGSTRRRRGIVVRHRTGGLANLRIKYSEDRLWRLYLIDEGNTLAGYLAMALLAAVWA